MNCPPLSSAGRPVTLATGWILFFTLLYCSTLRAAPTYSYGPEPFAFIDSSTHTDVIWTRAPGPPPNECAGGSAPVDDDISQEIPLGFTFTYGTTSYTTVRIMSNGRLQFGNNFCGFGTSSIGPPRTYPYSYPSNQLPRTMRIFGADLNPADGGTVRYASLGTAPDREFVVTWLDVPEWTSSGGVGGGAMQLQVVLRENGEFVYRYGTLNYTTGGKPQVGWELTTSDYAVVGYAAVADLAGTAIRFFNPSLSCGQIPSDYAVFGGTKVKVEKKVEVNGNAVAKGDTGPGSAVLPDGSRQTISPPPPLYALDPPTFPANGSTIDLAVPDNGSQSINASGDTFYRNVTVGKKATLTLTGGGPFHIRKLEAKKEAVINLAAGTYFIDELKLDDKVVLNVTSEPVILHVGSKADLKKKVVINPGGTVTGLRLYLHALAEFKSKDELDFTGLIYGPQAKKVEIGKKSAFHGTIVSGGEVKIKEKVGMTYTVADQALVAAITTCQVVGVDHFRISHDGFGIHCLTEPVTVTAQDAGGNTLTTYTGTITLDTGSGKGDWSLITGSGTLDNGTANDGIATYAFAAADNGQAVFGLDYREGAPSLNITVSDGSVTDDDAEGLLEFSASGFTVTASALPNPPPDPINDPIADQTAGIPFTIHITAYGQTPTDPQCGVIESYSGNHDLKFWSAYLDPGSGTIQLTVDGSPIATSEAAATNRTVNFSGGQAQVTAKYKDVGRIQVSMKDDSTAHPDLPDGIRGATNPFVVRPDHFELSAIQRTSDAFPNPAAADENGPVFIAAGEDFSVTVTARDAEGDATPNYGQESVAETVSLSANLVAPAGGSNPVLAGSFGSFSAGQATGTAFSWGEVGIITLTPAVGDGDYLGAGNITGTTSGNVGRFIPFDFGVALNTPQFATACSGFGYVGQPFLYSVAPVITVTARNKAGTTTANYTGNFWKITDSVLAASGNRSYTALTGTLDTGGLPTPDPVITDSGGGTGTLGFSDGGVGLAFLRGAPLAPFDAEIALSLDVIDEDGVVYGSNPVSFGSASAGGGIPFSAGKEQRWGRITLANAHGSELLSLPVPLHAEYYNGSGFVLNTDDGCTALSAGSASSPGDLVLDSAVQTGQRDGDILVTASASSTATIASSPLAAGDAGLSFSPPGAGNTGYIDLRVDLSALPWLRYDWDGDGNHDNDPTARATFGIFTGNRNLIYQREPWN